MTDDKLCRIATENLRNQNLKDTALSLKVEDLGHFTTTDGMIFDKTGNLYLGDLQKSMQLMKYKVYEKKVLYQDYF